MSCFKREFEKVTDSRTFDDSINSAHSNHRVRAVLCWHSGKNSHLPRRRPGFDSPAVHRRGEIIRTMKTLDIILLDIVNCRIVKRCNL